MLAAGLLVQRALLVKQEITKIHCGIARAPCVHSPPHLPVQHAIEGTVVNLRVPQGPVLHRFSCWAAAAHVAGSLGCWLGALQALVSPTDPDSQPYAGSQPSRGAPVGLSSPGRPSKAAPGRKPQGWRPRRLVKPASDAWPVWGHSIPFQAKGSREPVSQAGCHSAW